jgi:pilus assembly protein FimV
VHKSRRLAWLAVGTLLVLPWAAHAAGLGKLTVNSSLGQPLSAEIDLLGVQKKELDTLVAKLASPDTFKQGNIQYTSVLAGIKFSVEKKPDGQPYLKLTTKQPVNEAFLDFLIELNWSSGRLVKEYTVLLDPPGFTPTETMAPVALPEAMPLPAPVQEAQPELAGVPPDEKIGAEAVPEAAQAAAPEALAPPEAQALEAPATAPEPTPVPAEQKTYGPIKRGETLSKIAKSVKPSDQTLEQMLVGLFRSNKTAFMGNNMNRMKTGPVLRVPDSSELATIEPNQAIKEVRVQARDWNAYRQKLAEAAGQAAPTEIATQSASGKITTKVEDQAAPQEPGKEVLKLSKGESLAGKPGGTSKKALQERIRTLEEEAIAREKAVNEANERITLLEKNIKDMQKLLEVKSQSLAELQKQAGVAKATQPAAQPVPAPQPAAQPAPVAPKPAEVKAPESKPAEPKKPEVKPAVVAAAKPSPAPKPADTTKVPPAAETSLLDDILDNPLYLGGGAGVVILLLGLGYIAVRKKKSITSFDEENAVVDEDLRTSTVFGNTEGGVVVNTGDSSLMSDIASKSSGPVTTDDVDPVAEAEVYIAYGRDTQAEEILKEALKKSPTHHNIRLKLMEIYAARKNVPVFETLARELYTATGGKPGPIWDRVAQLGYALNPDNPMYESARSAAAESPLEGLAPSPPEMDFNIALPVTAGEQLSADIGMDSNAPASDKTFTSFDFEVPSIEPAKLTPDLPVESVPAASEAPLEMISFNFDSPAHAATPAAAPPSPPPAEAMQIDLSGISLNLDETSASPATGEPAKDEHWYEVQTKFDLAKAYQEMGDKEGAREILQEVIREGDAKQQEQAKGLLAKL